MISKGFSLVAILCIVTYGYLMVVLHLKIGKSIILSSMRLVIMALGLIENILNWQVWSVR